MIYVYLTLSISEKFVRSLILSDAACEILAFLELLEIQQENRPYSCLGCSIASVDTCRYRQGRRGLGWTGDARGESKGMVKW